MKYVGRQPEVLRQQRLLQQNQERRNRFRNQMTKRRPYNRYYPRFYGYCYYCNGFGHKAMFCRAIPRNNSSIFTYENARSVFGNLQTHKKENSRMYNNFDILNVELECYKWNNFGHVVRNYPLNHVEF